ALDIQKFGGLVDSDETRAHLEQLELAQLVHVIAVAFAPTSVEDVEREAELTNAPPLEQPVDLAGLALLVRQVIRVKLGLDPQAFRALLGFEYVADVVVGI